MAGGGSRTVGRRAIGSAPRSVGVDAVRVIGLVAVVAGHAYEGGLRSALYPWHAAVFFVLSGYLWTSARPFAAEVQRRVRSLALPYVAWLAVIVVVLVVWQMATGKPAAGLPGTLLDGEPPLQGWWFVTALMAACLLYRLAERVPWRWRGLIVAAALAAAYPVGPAIAAVPLSVGVAVPCVAFVFAGDALRRYRSRVSAPLPTGALLVLVGAVVFAAGLSPVLDLYSGQLGTPALGFAAAAAISVGLVLIGEASVDRLPVRVRAAIVQLAAAGIVVVLTHSAVLWLLSEHEPPHLAVAVAVVLPWLAGLVLARTRLAVLTNGSGPPLVRLRRLPVRAPIPGHRPVS
ncbi:acyltransferase [Luedemannella flava]|uniref:acyltransferase n=1 Tax=Luedemannella flava TaxID=349316 RepID=UPI0031CFD606